MKRNLATPLEPGYSESGKENDIMKKEQVQQNK